MRTTTSDLGRAALLLPLIALASGCARDFCVPTDGSRETILVNPVETGRNGTTNPHLFGTIQAALDAASAGVPTTICVASGTYYEDLTVRANVRLLGESTGDVLIRPPQTRRSTPAVAVDHTVLTVLSEPDRPISIRRMDLGGAAVCADVSGGGDVTLEDVRLTGCALGLRAAGGTLTVRRVPIKDHSLQGVLLTDLDAATFEDVEFFGLGGSVEPDADLPSGSRAAALDGVDLGGALLASGVSALSLRRVRLSDDRWTGALVSVRGGHLSVSDSRIDLLGLARGGSTPAFQTRDADVAFERVTLDGQGHGLLRASGTDRAVIVSDFAWRDDRPLEDPDAPGDRPPILELDLGSSDPESPLGSGTGQSTLELKHLSVVASAPTTVLQVDAPNLKLLAINSVFWGVGDGGVLAGEPTTWLGFSHVLTDDSTLLGDQIIGPSHDAYGDPGFDSSRFCVPASDGAARCRGLNLSGEELDLRSAPRPFDDGSGTLKAPDLGAIELQEPCP